MMEVLFQSSALKKCKCWRYYYSSKCCYLYPQVTDEVKCHAKVVDWIGMKATPGTSFSWSPQWRSLSSSVCIHMCGNHIPAGCGHWKGSGSEQAAHLSNFQNMFTPTGKRGGSESQMERETPVQSWLRMECPLIKHCTPVRFHSLSCPIRDSRNSNGVFRRQALAHLSMIYRNIQIPDSTNAFCTTDTARAVFSACQDPKVMANEEGL